MTVQKILHIALFFIMIILLVSCGQPGNLYLAKGNAEKISKTRFLFYSNDANKDNIEKQDSNNSKDKTDEN